MILILGVGLLLLTSFWAVYGLDHSTTRVSRDSVRLATVSLGDLSIDVIGSGRVKPSESHIIVAREEGEVRSLFVQPGTRLEAGDPVAQLENTELIEGLRRAKVELNSTESRVQVGLLDLKEDRSSYVERVSQSQSDYESARALRDAHEKLMSMPTPPLSRLEYDRSIREYQVAKERYEAAQSSLENYAEIEAVKVDQLNAELDNARSEVARLERRLERLNIVMPIAGMVQEVHVESGQHVNAGEPIAVVYAEKSYYLEAEVPALSSRRLSLGLPVIVSLAGEEYKGRVLRIDPRVVGSYSTVDIAFKHPQPEKIQVNMFANIRILVDERQGVLKIPMPNGAREFSSMMLYVVDAHDARYANLRSITFGAASSSAIEVISGLEVNDRVIISDISERANSVKRVRFR